MQAFDDVVDTGNLPNHIEDARLIAEFRASGNDVDDLIYLSLGESWTDTAPGLVTALGEIPVHANGYQLTPYGFPALRNTLRDYIIRTHNLDEVVPSKFDVAVSQGGTRAAMSDFGQFIRSCAPKSRVALIPEPGWDYRGVLAPLGFSVRTYSVSAENGWQPDPDAVEELINSSSDVGIIVLNPQHNPTGSDWSPSVVERLIGLASKYSIATLLDDAYYAVHAPGVPSTNALGLLLAETPPQPWLAVRTLGKQFRCNGWGLGALTSRPDTLAILSAIAYRRYYGTGVPLQAAMAAWLVNPDSDRYLEQLGSHYAAARAQVHRQLVDDLYFPDSAVGLGTCTSYMRFQIPPRLVTGSDDGEFRRQCLAAGVLPGVGSQTAPTAGGSGDREARWVRIHLGHSLELLGEAVNRLRDAGLGWS